MLSLEELAKRLKDRTISDVERATGVERRIIARVRDGQVTRPLLSDIEKLSKYFTDQEAELGLVKRA